ncbi:hypothetical protein EJ04DRAFT_428739, partial [Polyplosphaeria fusca]
GGIDMLELETLEKEGNASYSKAFNFLKERKQPLFFYAPQNWVILTDETSAIDGILLILTPNQLHEQLEIIADQVRDMAEYAKKGKAIVLINKMDEQGWSTTVFDDTVVKAKASLKDFGWEIER